MTKRHVVPPVVILVLILIGWETAVRIMEFPQWLLPAPTDIWNRFWEADRLWHHTQITVMEAAGGFFISLVTGLITAALIAHLKFLERGLFPYIIVSNAVPIVAIAPLLTIWFGYGMTPKVLIAAIITFFPIVTNATRGFQAADYRIVEMMNSLDASQFEIFYKVELPTATPYIFAGCKIALSLSLVGAVVGEFYGADEGLGYLIIYSANQLETALLFVSICILAVIGVTMFMLFQWLENQFAYWKG